MCKLPKMCKSAREFGLTKPFGATFLKVVY